MRRAALLVLAAAACVAALVLVRAWRFRPDPRTAGVLDVELEVAGEGGHSSMPPPRTAIGILAAAVKRVEDHPLPSRPTSLWRLLDVVGREMPFGSRLAVANAGSSARSWSARWRGSPRPTPACAPPPRSR